MCESGATGSTWRLHYALNLQTLGCDEVHLTEASVGVGQATPNQPCHHAQASAATTAASSSSAGQGLRLSA